MCITSYYFLENVNRPPQMENATWTK